MVSASWGVNPMVSTTVPASLLKQNSLLLQWLQHRGVPIPLFLQWIQHRLWSKIDCLYNGFSIVGCQFHCFYYGFSIVFKATFIECTMVSTSCCASSTVFTMDPASPLKQNSLLLQWFHHRWVLMPLILEWFQHRFSSICCFVYDGFSIVGCQFHCFYNGNPKRLFLQSLQHPGVLIPLTFTMVSAPCSKLNPSWLLEKLWWLVWPTGFPGRFCLRGSQKKLTRTLRGTFQKVSASWDCSVTNILVYMAALWEDAA